jgi:prolipoprotein diacylglyceryltransferase
MFLLFRSLFAPPRHLILLLAALWIGLALAEKRAERHNVSKDTLSNMAYFGILGYILGGRLIYVLTYFSAFARSPLSIFSLDPELFEPTGAS